MTELQPHQPQPSSPEGSETPPKAVEDEGVRLMLAYQGGDEQSFDQLVHLYAPRIYSLFTRFLGPKGEREDLVQETFLRVIRARRSYQPSARFSTWIFRIVYNLAINQGQRRKLTTGGGDPGDGSSDASFLQELADERLLPPEEQLERGDIIQWVRRSIAELKPNQRMALVLAKYEELSYAEIGAVLDCSEKAVKSLVHRARENLREVLGPIMERGVL